MSFREWFKGPAAPSPVTPAPVASAVDLAFWIVLWRAPGGREVEEWRRTPRSDDAVPALFQRLVGSAEFRLVLYGVLEDHYTGRLPREVEAGLRGLGDDASFLEWSFRALLGREV